MPIFIHKNIAYVVSRTEFLKEYKKLDTEEKSILENLRKGFDFTKSVLAITELFEKHKEKHKNENEPNKSLYSFNYYEKDAQDITMELLVLFSKFYHRLKIFDNDESLQSIREYLLPHKKLYFKETSNITIKDGYIGYTFYINQIRQIKGLVNNFNIYFDNQILHLSSNVYTGHQIKIIPYNYNLYNVVHEEKLLNHQINDSNYVFESNKPSRFKLLKYRKKGFLVVIQ